MPEGEYSNILHKLKSQTIINYISTHTSILSLVGRCFLGSPGEGEDDSQNTESSFAVPIMDYVGKAISMIACMSFTVGE